MMQYPSYTGTCGLGHLLSAGSETLQSINYESFGVCHRKKDPNTAVERVARLSKCLLYCRCTFNSRQVVLGYARCRKHLFERRMNCGQTRRTPKEAAVLNVPAFPADLLLISVMPILEVGASFSTGASRGSTPLRPVAFSAPRPWASEYYNPPLAMSMDCVHLRDSGLPSACCFTKLSAG